MFKVRRALFLQLGLVALAIVGLSFVLGSSDLVNLVGAAQQRVVDLGRWSAICYPFLFALCNILLLPGGILCVGAGFFFGLWWGFALVFVGNGIGAAVSFGISRWLCGRWLSSKLATNKTLAALEPAVEREGWKIVVLSQLHPLFPTSLLNYFYGLTKIRFRSYMFWASIGRVPGLFLYTYLGTLGQLGLNVARGKTHPRVVEYWTWGGAFIITGLILVILSRIALQAIQQSQATSNNSAPVKAAVGETVDGSITT